MNPDQNTPQTNQPQPFGPTLVPYHLHTGQDAPLLPFNNVAGTFAMVTSTPTWTPNGVANSIALNSNSAIIYYYDTTNKAWKATGPPFFDYQTFTTSGTWNKPSLATANSMVIVMAWGGGGGGGNDNNHGPTGGGGGGACILATLTAGVLSSSESVTIGAGGPHATAGGDTTFGSHVTAYGGGACPDADGISVTNPGGGGGGGLLGDGQPSTTANGFGVGGGPDGGTASGQASAFGGGAGGGIAPGGASAYGGGGGAGTNATGHAGGASVWGGGGGGTGFTGGSAPGGVSIYGGNGGAGHNGTNGDNGVAPGGGGGGTNGNNSGGTGARGECRVWTFF